ncbi:MAG: DUF268 domain-containing protein [Fibrobacteria bacterium]|nr:DUF268 domain-containing protein [Fibrobacteria bacterium]
MRKFYNRLYFWMSLLGFNPSRTIKSMLNLPSFFVQLMQLKKQGATSAHFWPMGKITPFFDDKSSQSGNIGGYYFNQDLLVANKIFKQNPQKHVDVGSRIDGFVAHVASFRTIEVFDIRPLQCDTHSIKFVQADLMQVDDKFNNYCDSLSCLHALEHFGLGRYGDPISYEGYIKGFKNLYTFLKPDGKFYFSVPIGPQRIEFNAHRVFSIRHLLFLFKDKFTIDDFSYVDDSGQLHKNVPLRKQEMDNNFNCTYGCGIFELSKCS